MDPTIFGYTTCGSPLVLFKSGYSLFSNFNPKTPFTYEGVNYRCVEQYYQASKASHFKDHDTWKKVMAARSPKQMKELGNSVVGYDYEKWENECLLVMKRGVREKMLQNPEAKKLLLLTKSAQIVEASRFDGYWSIGVDIEDHGVWNTNNWVGDNHMGKILMEVRDNL